MRPTRGFNSERANPFRDHFRAWKQSQKSQETKEIIILVNQYRTKMDDASITCFRIRSRVKSGI